MTCCCLPEATTVQQISVSNGCADAGPTPVLAPSPKVWPGSSAPHGVGRRSLRVPTGSEVSVTRVVETCWCGSPSHSGSAARTAGTDTPGRTKPAGALQNGGRRRRRPYSGSQPFCAESSSTKRCGDGFADAFHPVEDRTHAHPASGSLICDRPRHFLQGSADAPIRSQVVPVPCSSLARTSTPWTALPRTCPGPNCPGPTCPGPDFLVRSSQGRQPGEACDRQAPAARHRHGSSADADG
jgi:hypothetical protein